MKTNFFLIISVVMLFILPANFAFAHCDTMDGPTIADARKAIEKNNVNYALKWVQAADEKVIKEAFELTMKVRVLNPEAMTLADKYFFETLVRVHRRAEGIAYTGIKPSGTAIDKKILAADKAIAVGNLSPLSDLVPKDQFQELQKRFNKVMALKNFDVNNVPAGRDYIDAYVQFFHFAEGEKEGHNPGHPQRQNSLSEQDGHWANIPWILSGIFFLTTTLFGILYFRSQKNTNQ